MHDVLVSRLSAPVLAVTLDVSSIIGALIYSLIGIVLFAIAFLVIVKISPFSIRKEIEEDQNTSLAILMGSVIIGLSLIIAAAVHG